jgi:flagellar basal-body rod protein FlgC
MSSTIDIAVSGLRAQAKRMSVVASNIANANTSRTDQGVPYRRKEVVLSSLIEELGGVEVLDVAEDLTSDFKQLYQPGHPDADSAGYVLMPNVDLPVEIMHMVTASRAYQANAAILKRYQDSVNIAIELLR